MDRTLRVNPRVRQQQLRGRIQWMTWILVLGSFLAGVTALPLATELDMAARFATRNLSALPGFIRELEFVRDALHDVYGKYPFFGYGTDWLAFAHIVIAIAFARALTHPLRNSWLFTWAIIVSILVIPWALICGEIRQIPLGWRLIDCSFGVGALIPSWLAQRWCKELERLVTAEGRTPM